MYKRQEKRRIVCSEADTKYVPDINGKYHNVCKMNGYQYEHINENEGQFVRGRNAPSCA